MNFIKVILLGLCISLSACQSSTKSQNKSDSTSLIEQGNGKIVEGKFLIVPGQSVGEISLNEDMMSVSKKLGKPDDGDAAMGKAWGIWYSNDSNGNRNELAIYSSYRDTSMRIKDVKQIRITSKQFKSQDGFTVGQSEYNTKLKFPAMERVAAFLNEKKDTISIYDAKQDGISFEFLKGECVALTVHPVNNAVNNTYLTLHPEWKSIE